MRRPRYSFRFRFRWFGWVFLIIYIVGVSLLLRQAAAGPVSAGLNELTAGRAQIFTDTPSAQQHFANATTDFNEALARLRQAPGWVKIATPLPPARWYVRLIKSLSSLASAGQEMSALASHMPEKPSSLEPEIFVVQGTNTYMDWYTENQGAILRLRRDISQANTELSAIPPWVLLGKSRELENVQAFVTAGESALDTVDTLHGELKTAFGDTDDRTHTFLILFQNDAELRPSGGFLGSYAVLTASGGYVHAFAFGQNVYPMDKAFYKKAANAMEQSGISQPDKGFAKVKDPPLVSTRSRTFANPYQIVFNPPLPLRTLSTQWGFRDSNIDLPFRDGLFGQVADFYELSSGVRVDGVVAVDASILEDLLQLTGPVILPGVQPVTVSADNVRDELTEEVEVNYWTDTANQATNNPKQIINKFIPVLLNTVIQKKISPVTLSRTASKAVERKSVQLWSRLPELNQTFGNLQPLDEVPGGNNWIKIVNTNFGGKKSSLNVIQDISGSVSRRLNGTISVDLEIKRRHTGDGAWPDGINYNLMQIYLPTTATVTRSPVSTKEIVTPRSMEVFNGIDGRDWQTWTTQTNEWQRLNLWATTHPQQTTTYHLSYELPAGTTAPFTLIPQAGQKTGTINISLP